MILSRTGPTRAFRIQDEGTGQTCTPVAIAKARLSEAKAALEAMGIVPSQNTRRSAFHSSVAGASRLVDDSFDLFVTFEPTLEPEPPEPDEVLSNAGVYQLHVGKKVLPAFPFSLSINNMAGGFVSSSVLPAFVSPEGTTAFIFAETSSGNMRGMTGEMVLLGVATAPAHPEPQSAPDDVGWFPASRVEVAGWGKGGLVAFRVFDNETGGTPCPGYIDAAKRPFTGGLSLVLFNGHKRIDGFRIQDDPSVPGASCTPASVAQRRLAVAKATLKYRGIKTEAKGFVGAFEGAPEQPGAAGEPKDGGVSTRTWKSLAAQVPLSIDVKRVETLVKGKPTTAASFVVRRATGTGSGPKFEQPGTWTLAAETIQEAPDHSIAFIFGSASNGTKRRWALLEVISK
jgi:hypothetical protein